MRTFARVAPSDAVEAAVQVTLQRSLGCTKVYVLTDEEVDGEDFATSFGVAAQQARLRVVATQQYDPLATSYRSLATTIASSGANCVLVSAISGSNAVSVTRQVAAAVPKARIFAGAGVAQSTYVDPAKGRRSAGVGLATLHHVAGAGGAGLPAVGPRVPEQVRPPIRTAAARRDIRV